MDKNFSKEDSDYIDWDTKDELEIQDTTFSSCRDLRTTGRQAISGDGEASSSSVPGQSNFIQKFVVMGFPEESIAFAIEQNGENSDLVLDALLTFKAVKDSPEEQPSASPHLEPCINSDDSSSEYNENFLDDVYEEYSWSSDSDYCTNATKQFYLKEESSYLFEKEQTLLSLLNMGYPVEEVSIAMERCEASLDVLTDCLDAAQKARAEEPYLLEDVKPKLNHILNGTGGYKKRKIFNQLCKSKGRFLMKRQFVCPKL